MAAKRKAQATRKFSPEEKAEAGLFFSAASFMFARTNASCIRFTPQTVSIMCDVPGGGLVDHVRGSYDKPVRSDDPEVVRDDKERRWGMGPYVRTVVERHSEALAQKVLES